MENSQARRAGRRPVRASAVFLALVLLLSVAGFWYLTTGERMVTAYVAAVDLPAFYQIEERDLRRVTMPRRDVPDNALFDKEGSIGRYTLSPIKQDRAFDLSRMGPRLAVGSLDRIRVMAVPATPETTVGGTLQRGDVVSVVTPAQRGSLPQWHVGNVLVLDVTGGTDASVVLGFTPSQSVEFASNGRVDGAVLTRVQPYARP